MQVMGLVHIASLGYSFCHIAYTLSLNKLKVTKFKP